MASEHDQKAVWPEPPVFLPKVATAMLAPPIQPTREEVERQRAVGGSGMEIGGAASPRAARTQRRAPAVVSLPMPRQRTPTAKVGIVRIGTGLPLTPMSKAAAGVAATGGDWSDWQGGGRVSVSSWAMGTTESFAPVTRGLRSGLSART